MRIYIHYLTNESTLFYVQYSIDILVLDFRKLNFRRSIVQSVSIIGTVEISRLRNPIRNSNYSIVQADVSQMYVACILQRITVFRLE